MTKKEIEIKVKDTLINHFGLASEAVENVDTKIDDLGLDSLDFVEYIMDIESIFAIHVQDEEMDDIKTIQNVIDCVYEKIQ